MKDAARELIYPSRSQLAWRRFFIGGWRAPLAPANIQIVQDGIKRADKLANQGCGILSAFTHFCSRDIFEMLARPLGASRVLFPRHVVASVEWSHYYERTMPRVLAWLTGITLVPIVNDRTIEKRKNYDAQKHLLQLGHGQLEYFRIARRALKEGGLVLVSPQQGRRSRLELSDKEPIRFLLGKGQELEQVAILFLGLSLRNEVNYSKRTLMNFGRTYDVALGPTLTRDELVKLGQETARSIDDLTMIILSLLVDPGYNAIPPDATRDYIIQNLNLPPVFA